MPQSSRLDYRNQDLRNRSFKRQDLAGADFSGSDIRGCNFSNANLKDANFQRVRTGRSLKQRTVQLALAVSDASNKIYTVAAVYIVVFTVVFTATFGFTFTAALAEALAGALTAFASGATAERMAWSVLLALLAVFAIYPFRAFCANLKRKILYIPGIIFPGTVFEYADLTSASFAHASLQNADFSSATLDFVKWTNASFARCKLPKSFNDEIRALVTNLDGHDQDYRYANLKNLHLAGVILTGANLAEADLSGSKLNYANLERANLRGIQASGTDFSNAMLTGACIQHWGINATTRFTDVRCDYIYLEPDNQERRPASGIFQPGDFEKLVHQFTDTLDFLFRNGIDPQAFDVALRNLLTKYEDAGLSLHSLVDVGDGDRLVKLTVANPAADKAPMHEQFMQDYQVVQQQLVAERERTQALQQDLVQTKDQLVVAVEKHSVFLERLVYHQTDRFSRPSINAPNSHFIGDFMPVNDNNIQFGNVQGDVSGITGGDLSGVAGKDITGAAGGDISGTLTLTLGQLEATKDPDALKLADLLKQLKTAIETPDAGLDAKDKEKALKHLDAIAKLGSDRTNPDLLERAGDALDALPTIVKRGNGLLEFSEKYLPTITAGIKTVLAAGGVVL